YFPEALTTWGLYVLSTLIVITVVKLLNLALHAMYDEAQIVSDTSLKKSSKILRKEPTDEDGGIEMQVLGDPSSRTSAENNISNDISQANSAISIDFPEQMTSTIDLKVDVHRKNSSESSESIGHSQKKFNGSDVPISKEVNRRSLKIKSKSEETPVSVKRSPTSDDSEVAKAEEIFDQIRDIREQKRQRLPIKYRRQLSIHSEQTGMGLVFSGDSAPSLKLQRHRSTEANEEHRHDRQQGFYQKNSQQLQSVPSDLRYYIPVDEKQKLGMGQTTASMRKDSSSTMSAIQLPTMSGPSIAAAFNSSSRSRRHSTATGKPSMRRIKSAALETCCDQPSVSNLTAHPNSAETIGGQTLINPQHAVLPPPSKSLIRNQHLNLYSKDNSSSSCTSDNGPASKTTSQIIEPVYPIAEQADERYTNDCFFESDIDRAPTQSTDSDTENNGSRSPLLDMKTRNGAAPPVEKKTLTQPEKLKKSSPSEEEAIATAAVLAKAENVKGEDSGCPSSDCDQASASSKDMLLTQDVKDLKKPAERMWFDFSMDSNNICVDVTDPGEGSSKMISSGSGKEQKNLGAIPKTSVGSSRKHQLSDHFYDEVDEMIRTKMSLVKSSRTSSAASSSRCSGASYSEYERPPIDVLHETSDGCAWILETALTNPILPAPRDDEQLSPIYGCKTLYPMTRMPRLNYNRHHPPVIRRETRNRPQNASFDTTVSSKDDDNSSRLVSGWEYDNLEMQSSINADILLKQLMEHNKATHLSDVVQQAEGNIPISLGAVDFNDSVFREYWRHYSLPPEKPVQPKRFYKFPFHCFGKHELKISMDRLQLLALFDRDLGWFPAFLAIVLAALVSVLGSVVLRLNIYKDIFAFIFCFVIAGSQYSLLKSVQPDASSPIHGFNKTVAYSRPIYFCLCSSLLILANHLISDSDSTYQTIILFNIPIVPNELFRLIQYLMSMLLLMMPIFFSLGLFPQINTFLIYMLEQLDMHLFGGNAVCSLLSAFLGVLRSILACFILYGPVFGGLSEPRGTQHILFSIFCSLLIAISYHLSRSASDFSCVWSLIKSSLFIHTDDEDDDKEASNQTEQVDVEHKKTDNEHVPVNAKNSNSDSDVTNKDCDLEDPLPRKLQSTVNSRLKNDFLVCIVMGVLVFSLHCTTVFTVLQPELLDIICKIAAQLGFVLHYFVPQLRKHLPWLCVAQPVLRQNEFGQFEARKAAKVMWFEKTYVCMCFFEKNILYPLLFLSALTENSTVIVQKFGVAFGAAIIVVCGLK
ncbi:Pecanex-like protein 1, partial [Pseudolycoriella hygida]